MYDVRTIADYVVTYYDKNDWMISNLKLQKVLYFLQAQYLVSTDEKLFEDEIEAWNFGPVVPAVYNQYAVYGNSPIPAFNKKIPRISRDDAKIINPMLGHLRNYSSTYLTNVTIKQKPWLKNYSECGSKIIPANEIRDYFMED
jgi:uncharacterized phage-associated protein